MLHADRAEVPLVAWRRAGAQSILEIIFGPFRLFGWSMVVDGREPQLKMLAIGNGRIAVAYHGIARTHLGSLAHINDNGVFFNGYRPDP